MSDDVTFHDDSWPDHIQGIPAVQHWLSLLFTAFTELEGKVTQKYFSSDANGIALHWNMAATNTGDYEPLGLQATGRRVFLESVEFLTLRDGLVVTGRGIFNAATLLPEIGDQEDKQE